MSEHVVHIDGDILVYQYGSLLDESGRPLTWNLIVNHLNAKIREIIEKTGADKALVYITGSNNFRKDVATIKPYKGNRKDKEKPHSYEKVQEYLKKGHMHACVFCEDFEADDGMAMAQRASHTAHGTWDYSTIASNDKDLKMVPGYHYSWKVSDRISESPRHMVGEIDGLRWFYKQLLMGDSTDNIPGLYKVGAKSTLVKRIDELEDEMEMYTFCKEQYNNYFGSYDLKFMHENAILLWMVQGSMDSGYHHEIVNRLTELEERRVKIESAAKEEEF